MSRSPVPIQENARLASSNPYGESKLLVERMLAWFNRIHGLRYASLRYFNAAGAPEEPGGVLRGEAHEPESHLIPLVLDVALGRRKTIRIYGDDYPTRDGTCIRDYVHVSDLADAHVLALETLRAANDDEPLICNLGNGQGFSVREVIGIGAPRHRSFHSRLKSIPAVPATLLFWWPARRRRCANLAGSRAMRSSTRSFAPPGSWHQKRYADCLRCSESPRTFARVFGKRCGKVEDMCNRDMVIPLSNGAEAIERR